MRVRSARLRGAMRVRPAALAVVPVLAAVVVRALAVWGPQVDYDEGVYWESLRAMRDGHALFTDVYSSQPPGFLVGLLPFFVALGHGIVAARLAMVVCATVLVAAVFVVARALDGRRAAIAAAAIALVDPLLLRQSVTLQADGPSIALGTAAVALALLASRRARAPWLSSASGGALAAAVLVKLFAVAFAVPVVFVLISWGTGRSSRQRVAAASWVAAGAAIAGAALLLPFTGAFDEMRTQVVGGHLRARSLQEGGLTGDMLASLARELPLLIAALAGLILLVRHRHPHRRDLALVTAWLAASLAILLAQRPLWPHHVALLVPPLAIAAAPALALIRARTAAACAAIAWLVLGALALRHPATADSAPALTPILATTTPSGALVITDDQYSAAAADRDTPPSLVDTSYVRIDSQPLSTADVERLAADPRVRAVCFVTGRLDHLPGLRTWVAAHFPHRVQAGGATVYLL